jgi:MscS family membrane protein
MHTFFTALIATDTARLWLTRIGTSVIVALAAWALDAVLNALIKRSAAIDTSEAGARNFLHTCCKTLLWLIAGTLILRIFGHDVGALLAGLGLGGAALALASKDTLANFFGSISVFVDRPFHLGDRIKIMGFEGTITAMGIRTARLQTLENCMVSIPNSVFTANPIENISARPAIRVSQTIALKTDNGVEKITLATALLKAIAAENSGCSGEAQAGVVSLNAAVCQVSFVYFVQKDADYAATLNALNLAVLTRFREAGIILG